MTPQTSFPKHIFLAEDDEDDRFLFNEALSLIEQSATLTWAANGLELMQNLKKNANPLPDVIFIDLNMPLKNGYECLAEIRKDGNGIRNLPIVVLTTSSSQKNIDMAYEMGASYYAVKPGSFDGLKAVIGKAIRSLQHPQLSRPDKKDFILSV